MSTNSPITCSTFSRCTLRMPAMATPTRCTSFGPRWRSTCAASVSPSDSRRIAAFSTLLNLVAVRLSFIGVDPLFHHLGDATRIFRHQALDCIELRIIPLARTRQEDALRAAEADPISRQFTGQTAHLTQLDIAMATASRQPPAFTATGDVVQHGAQHAEHQHQNEQ